MAFVESNPVLFQLLLSATCLAVYGTSPGNAPHCDSMSNIAERLSAIQFPGINFTLPCSVDSYWFDCDTINCVGSGFPYSQQLKLVLLGCDDPRGMRMVLRGAFFDFDHTFVKSEEVTLVNQHTTSHLSIVLEQHSDGMGFEIGITNGINIAPYTIIPINQSMICPESPATTCDVMNNITKDINSIPRASGSMDCSQRLCNTITCVATEGTITTVLTLMLLQCNATPGIGVAMKVNDLMGLNKTFTHSDTVYFVNTEEIQVGFIINITHSIDGSSLGLMFKMFLSQDNLNVIERMVPYIEIPLDLSDCDSPSGTNIHLQHVIAITAGITLGVLLVGFLSIATVLAYWIRKYQELRIKYQSLPTEELPQNKNETHC